MSTVEGKRLLILGANPETIELVKTAREMGVYTVVSDHDPQAPAKAFANKAYNVDGMNVAGLVALAQEENVSGVLVGVADLLVSSYCKVCDALGFPCYATPSIVEVFNNKDRFKAQCEQYGIHGVPEYYLDATFAANDIEKMDFPVVVKPVDSASGVGITVCEQPSHLEAAVAKALSASRCKRFIVEKYMECDDMGFYFSFQDGVCSVSCVYDRYTTGDQPGVSRVCLGGTYPSKHLDAYYERMHPNAMRLFRDMGIKDGVLMLSAFYSDGEFYVYDTGFRLQGEAPHLLMKAIHGFDQREMLIRYALTGSQGTVNLATVDDVHFRGHHAATLWFLLREGTIGKIEHLREASEDPAAVAVVQRLHEGDPVRREWIGTEKQVLARIYLVCDSKEQLRSRMEHYLASVKAFSTTGEDMLLRGLDVAKALA